MVLRGFSPGLARNPSRALAAVAGISLLASVLLSGVALADLIGTIVGDAEASVRVQCLQVSRPDVPGENTAQDSCGETNVESWDPWTQTYANAGAVVIGYPAPIAPDVYVQAHVSNTGAPTAPLAYGSARGEVRYDVAIREERTPPHAVGFIPAKGFVTLFHEWESLFYPPDLNNYAEAKVSLELDLGPGGIDIVGEWATNWLEPTDAVDQVVYVDILPELVYTVRSLAQCHVTIELAISTFTYSGDCQAYADPGFVFDQERFDQIMGANTFELSEYYSVELSPNLFTPAVPSIHPIALYTLLPGLLVGAGLVALRLRKSIDD